MPKYTYVHPVTGQKIKLEGDTEPTDADVEQAFNDLNNWKSRSNNLLANRPNLWAELGGEIKAEMNPAENKERFTPLGRVGSLGKMALLGMGAPAQSVEGAIAAPALTALRGERDPQTLLRAAKLGLTGEYPAEYGDVITQLGGNEDVSKLGGLALSALTPGMSQLAKGTSRLRTLAGRGVEGVSDAIGRGTVKGAMTIGRIPKNVRDYSVDKNFNFVGRFLEPGAEVEDKVLNAQNKARVAVSSLRERTSKDFGNSIQPFQDMAFNLNTRTGIPTVTTTVDRMINEGLIKMKGSKYVSNSRISEVSDFVGILNDLNKGVAKGKDLRKALSELDAMFPAGRSSLTPFVQQLKEDIRNTLRQKPELAAADDLYAKRVRILEGDPKRGIPSAEKIVASAPTGTSTLDRILVNPNTGGQRARNVLGEVEQASGMPFTDELYNASANKALSSWSPGTLLSLAGVGTAISQTFKGNPTLALGSLAAALGISPKGIAVTNKAINSIRSKAIALRSTPLVSTAADLIEKGFIDPAMARQVTGRNDVEQ